MKQQLLVGVLASALATVTLGAMRDQAASKAQRGAGATNQAGHTEPKMQPPTAPPANAPTGEMQLGSVHIAKAVKADGKPLPAGTYQVRLTAQNASPEAKGESASLERWVEFVQGGQVKGREVVTIVPQ